MMGARIVWTLRPRIKRTWALAALFVAEVVLIALCYQFFADIECRETGAQLTCDFLRSLVARAFVVFAAAALLIWARPQAMIGFSALADNNPGAGGWRWLHLAGLLLLFVPLLLTKGENLSARFDIALLPWAVGAIAGSVGGLLWMAPPAAWRAVLSHDRWAPIPILLAAALVPDLARAVLPIWDWQVLTTGTFIGVAVFLSVFADGIVGSPETYVIGLESFSVHIARQCSGVEGFALVTAFTCLYGFVFRREVRFPRYWLVVLPIAIGLSWLLNIVRIGVLILLGAYVSPEVAVNGFHSYAGWLFFTLLALGLMGFVQMTPWLHRPGARVVAVDPVRHDPVAAMILPFAVFMVAGTAASAFFDPPGLGYPLIALSLLLAAIVFQSAYRKLDWAPDPLAWAAGGTVGMAWLALAAGGADPALSSALAGLGSGALAAWIALRLLGTIVLVPLVEEMFFRGYVLTRLDGAGLGRRLLALAVSSALFALLHGRWVEAFAAGVVFGLLMLRRGRVSGAIQAHVVANLVVASAAFAQGDWSLI